MVKKWVNHISETREVTGKKVDQVGEFKATANEEIVDSLWKSTKSFDDELYKEDTDDSWDLDKIDVNFDSSKEKKSVEMKIDSNEEIIEFVSWVPSEWIGQQMFKVSAIKRFWLSKYLPSKEDIEKMTGVHAFEGGADSYKDFLKKSKNLFLKHSFYKQDDYVEEPSSFNEEEFDLGFLVLKNGDRISFGEDCWIIDHNNWVHQNEYVPLRLLKD